MTRNRRQERPALTMRQLARLIDRPAWWEAAPGLSVPVRILDVAPERFGRVDCTITPLGGAGTTTVALHALTVIGWDEIVAEGELEAMTEGGGP